jgi:glycosyltransferase involved in cell wall biosynthesis
VKASTKDLRILVIIPAYNEEASLEKVIGGVRHHLPGSDILVINDGSTDETSSIAHAQGASVVDLPYNTGIGATVQTGYLFALREGHDAALQVDGDGQHDPAHLESLIEPLRLGHADMVIGSRYLAGESRDFPWARKLGSKVFSFLLLVMTRSRMTDPTSGFRAINRPVIEFLSGEYPSDYPEVEAIVLLHKKGFRVKEIPVTMLKRQGGKSSINLLRSVYYMVKVTTSIFIGNFRKF